MLVPAEGLTYAPSMDTYTTCTEAIGVFYLSYSENNSYID